MSQDSGQEKTALQSRLDGAINAWSHIVAFMFAFPGVFVSAVMDTVSGVLQKIWGVVAWVFMTILGIVRTVFGFVIPNPEDPFRLRVFGESLFTERVRMDLAGLSVILLMSAIFEYFAWKMVWKHTAIEETVLIWIPISFITLLPFAFASLVVSVDRAVIIMDDSLGGKVRGAVPVRIGMLFMLALITAVPVELGVFGPEIDRVIEAREKVKVDEMREKAKTYEVSLAEKEAGATSALLNGGDDDVVARRAVERESIVRRLEAKTEDVAREVAGGRSGRVGDGPVAKALRQQEADLRKELSDFDKETERMRKDAVQSTVDDRTRHATELDRTLQRIEAMTPEELAAAYGGDYKEPDGFMSRYRVLLQVTEEDYYSWMISWGCRLISIVFGVMVIFGKYFMLSPSTVAYFSLKHQFLAGNAAATHTVKALARGGNKEAIRLLRTLSAEDDGDRDFQKILFRLGYDDNDVSAWSDEVVNLHSELSERRRRLARAVSEFRNTFRRMCEERVQGRGGLVGIPRSKLVERSQNLWDHYVSPHMLEVSETEGIMRRVGVKIPAWSQELLGVPDPIRERYRLWELNDDRLHAEYGWCHPDQPELRAAK